MDRSEMSRLPVGNSTFQWLKSSRVVKLEAAGTLKAGILLDKQVPAADY